MYISLGKNKEVYIIGDVHGRFNHIKEALPLTKVNALFQVGDFGYFPTMENKEVESLKELPFPVFFCDGNHEDHEALKKAKEYRNDGYPSNIYHMPRGSVVSVNGLNVLFFGGANSIDKNERTPGLDWFPEETISESDMYNLPDCTIDVVISHTCPDEFFPTVKKAVGSLYTEKDHSRKALSYILNKYKPMRWYFGHFHKAIEGTYKDTQWRCLDKIDSDSPHWEDRILPL